MKNNTYKIEVDYQKAGLDPSGCEPTLTAYAVEDFEEIPFNKRPAVVVCAGGGYDFRSDREAEPVCLRFVGYGIQAFLLNYSVYRKPFPTALLEAAQAVAFVRQNAEKFGVDPNRIFILGFSAGGHLAASLSVHWNKPFVKEPLGFLGDECKPNGSVLCYPVITSGELSHEGSILNLVGENKPAELLELVSCDKQVNKDTPKAFLWHTADDGCVPVQNTLLYAGALADNNIIFEAHVFDYGGHGLSLADVSTAMHEGHLNPNSAQWFKMAVDWIHRN